MELQLEDSGSFELSDKQLQLNGDTERFPVTATYHATQNETSPAVAQRSLEKLRSELAEINDDVYRAVSTFNAIK